MTHESVNIPGFGTYVYDMEVYVSAMEMTVLQLQNRVFSACEGMEAGTRTKIRKLRKNQLAAMVAEWNTAVQENERSARYITAMVEAGTPYSQDALDDLLGDDIAAPDGLGQRDPNEGIEEWHEALAEQAQEAVSARLDELPVTEIDMTVTTSGNPFVVLVQSGTKLIWGTLIAVVNRRTRFLPPLLATVEINGTRRLINADDVLMS